MISSSFFPRVVGREEANLWSIRLGVGIQTGAEFSSQASEACAEMCREDWLRVVHQARDLGAQCVVLLAQDAQDLSQVLEIAQAIKAPDLDLWINCEAMHLSEEAASLCFEMGVSFVLKLDAQNKDVERWMGGDKTVISGFSNAFEALRNSGYPSGEKAFAVHFSLTEKNRSIAKSLWHDLRTKCVQPFFDLELDRGAPSKSPRMANWLESSNKIRLTDDFPHDFDFCPPFFGGDAMVEAHTCFVDQNGTVFPNESLRISLGSVRENCLAETLAESEVFEDFGRHELTIKGPCRTCDHSADCFGSRTAAYVLTGDYLASDPTCWKNEKKIDQIPCLPVHLEDVIPQKWPMRMVDTLEQMGERSGTVSVTIRPEMPMVTEEGTVDPAFFLEMMAQAMAAVTFFKKKGAAEQEAEGLLLGAQDLEVFSLPRTGDQLKIHVYKYFRFG